MKVNAEVRLVQVDINELLQCHKPVEVNGYCESCSNYKRNYTCPGFEFDVLKRIESFKYATLIMTQIDTRDIKAKQSAIEKKTYTSRVFTNYVKHNPDVPTDWKAMLSMYVFDHVKGILEKQLLDLETTYENSMSLPPGSCTRCAECTRISSKPCLYPEDIRYSLEALGFLVSDIYKNYFKIELGWTDDDLPESFNTCSALFSKNPLNQDDIISKLGNIDVSL